MTKIWDVIVVGAGHAGCEAAHACAQMKRSTLLVTMTLDNIAAMSCNPAIGGVAKGHLVREVDALGGIMGMIADETGIQFRRLNTKKGAAVQATRCQSDMLEYKIKMKLLLEKLEHLEIKQREVTSLLWNQNKVEGVITNFGENLKSKTVVITTGTFLNGTIHIGKQKFAAGRAWEFPSKSISEHLQDQGLLMGRLKTGTTPRLNKNSIDFLLLEVQPGDTPQPKFSFWGSKINLQQVPCHITYTNSTTHEIIEKNLEKSAMYGGEIHSVGPRYCPSIEDKVVRFPDRDRHQIFLEPTSLKSVEIYPNGMSTSMPLEVQVEFMRSIKGFKNVEIMRPGYAIEYDFAFPHQLKTTLELKDFENLYLAGQMNGTTGYEEAAAQGLISGINAALKSEDKEPFVLLRNESYIGVLIDDLIAKGTQEPYRMFTSRAEYRLLLREDNADERLCKKGFDIGLLSIEKYQAFVEKQKRIDKFKLFLQENYLLPKEEVIKEFEKLAIQPPKARSAFVTLLKHPKVSISFLEKISDQSEFETWSSDEKKFTEADIKYEGYIKRQASQIKNYLKMESIHIPDEIDYLKIGGLSNEVIEKLSFHKPQTLGQANKISGVTPAAITILMVYIRNRGKNRAKAS